MEGPELRPLPEPEPDLELDVDEPSELDPQTVLAAVRAQWEQPAEEHTFDLELPGSRGMFVLRCGPIRGAVLGKLRQRLEKSRSPEKDTNLNADVLIAACRGMYGRPSPTGELVLLEDEEGPLLRLDERLAQAMGMSGMTTARSIVLALFRHANVPDLAIAKAAGSYMEWASEAADDVSEELLGES